MYSVLLCRGEVPCGEAQEEEGQAVWDLARGFKQSRVVRKGSAETVV